MNKTLVLITALLAALLLSVSCITEQASCVRPLKTLSSVEAIVKEMPQAKAHLVEESKIKWDLNEVIYVFSEIEGPVPFKRDGESDRFIGDYPINGTEFYAFTPEWMPLNPENRKVLTFPADIACRNACGKNPSFNIPMVAKFDGKGFSFSQTCGILHFRIKNPEELDSVSLAGNGGEILYGGASVDLNESLPVLCFTGTDNSTYRYVHFDGSLQSQADEPYDIYFALPPMTFASGFTVNLNFKDGRSRSKSTQKSVTVSRAVITNYILDIDALIKEEEDALTAERNALIDFYNAMDGPNWTDNTNWCSDKPVGEWSNVYTNWEGHVVDIQLWNNNLKGTIPDSFSNLTHLKFLQLTEHDGPGFILNYEPALSIKGLTNIIIGNCLSRYDEDLLITLPENLGEMQDLRELIVYGVKGTLPEGLFKLDNLENLELSVHRLEGTLPSDWSHMRNLQSLRLSGAYTAPLAGELPKDLFNCTNLTSLVINGSNISGELPGEIGNLYNLDYLALAYNKLSGTLPAELTKLNLSMMELSGNNFSGMIPAEFSDWPSWKVNWGRTIAGTNLDMSGAMPYVPEFDVSLLSGGHYTSRQLCENKLTLCFQWASWCSFSSAFIPEIKNLYSAYKDQGLEILSWSSEEEDLVRRYVADKDFPWLSFASSWDNCIGESAFPMTSTPCVTAFDSNGRLVYYTFGLSSDLTPFVMDWFGDTGGELYTSQDFSADGTVHVLQAATEGAGIDIILMGDGYSDRQIADDTYKNVMTLAMDSFFGEEPFASYRNCFNVSYVDVVSKNEGYLGQTALGTWYGQGSVVGGNDDTVRSYADKVLYAGGRSADDALVIVLMNRDTYGGTCYMTRTMDGDYGRGFSISYLPVSSDRDVFASVLRHEAGGHGFAKLADEYTSLGNASIPREAVEEYRVMEPYGWWRNIDFTSDPQAVKWTQFIADGRYASEGLGVYEGACTYASGAFRPTVNSIMNDNTGGFNAPSRFAIWYRINKLAYGPEWTGTYEDFVTRDLAHRMRAPRKSAGVSGRKLPPLAPPVVKY